MVFLERVGGQLGDGDPSPTPTPMCAKLVEGVLLQLLGPITV